MPLTFETYERVALEDPEGNWELHGGRLRRRSSGTFGHNHVSHRLAFAVYGQLDHGRYHGRINLGRLRCSAQDIYVPDAMVIPDGLTAQWATNPHALEVYDDPVPFVLEVCDAPIADDAADAKLPGYRARGDAEVWRVHPFEHTLTVWRRRPDGGYDEAAYIGGVVAIASLPGVMVDIDALWVVD